MRKDHQAEHDHANVSVLVEVILLPGMTVQAMPQYLLKAAEPRLHF